VTGDDRRPTDWPDDRLADAFLARAAARPTPADLAEATLERVRASSPRSTSGFGLRSIGALAAAAAIVIAVGAIAIGQRPVEPANQPTMALGLPVVSVSDAIATRDSDPTDREIAVRGFFSPAQPISCPAPQLGTSENPIRLDCPLMTQWLLENPERLVTRSSNSMEGRGPTGPAFHAVFPFLDMSAVTAASVGDDPVDMVVIGHFHDRRGDPDTSLCGGSGEAGCDGFVVDGIHSVAGTRVASSTVIDLEPWPPEPRHEPTWTPDDVDRLVMRAVPSFAILSRVALPGHRIRELEPSLGTGALGIIDRPIAWVVTGLDASASGSPPVRRTFLIVDGTAEAYETAPWNVEPNVGFVPFALVPLPLASPEATDAAAEPITLDLVDLLDRHLSVEIVDESGLFVSAAPVAPGTPSDVPTPGNDVAVSQVANRPNEVRLSWVGGACDGGLRFTIRPDGRTISEEALPWEGETDHFCILVGIPRGLTLTFSEPVPASEVTIVKSSAPSSPAPSESPVVSTVVGEPISVRAALEHRDNDLDDTEIAVKGWLVALAVECLGTPEPPVSPAELHCGDGLVWLAEEPPTPVGQGLVQPEPPAFNVLVRPETYKQVVVVQPGQPVEVIVLGHFDDHRAAQCRTDQVETCRRNFLVDAVLDATQPSLDLNAIEKMFLDPTLVTVARAADAERVATATLGGGGTVLAAFAVAGSNVTEFEPQAAESTELTSAAAVWIVRYVDVGIEETRPVLKTKLIIDGPIDSLDRSIYVPSPDGLLREVTVID
jgi:hypothetical protein